MLRINEIPRMFVLTEIYMAAMTIRNLLVALADMRLRRRAFLSYSILVVCLCLVPILSGAQQTEADRMEHILQQQSARIDGWEKTAGFLVGLTVFVGVLGIAAGLLQTGQASWCKRATVVVGATISVITVVNNIVFPNDYRTLRNR